MRYRLVALDLDGTVLPKGRPVSERVARAIRACIASGVQVVLASGRMYRMLAPFAEQLGIAGPQICYGGAVIRDTRDGAVWYERRIPTDLACAIVAAGRDAQLPVHAYAGDEYYVERCTADHPMIASLQRNGARPVDDLDALLRRTGLQPHHMAVVTADDPKPLVLRLRERFGSVLDVTSGHPNMAELDLPGVSKGAALAWLAESLEIPREQVLAAGDDWNDLSMIAYAGFGVAMGNAPTEVHAVAHLTAPSIDDDGIAQVLEEHVLG